MEGHEENSSRIAIVGMDCRLPEADNVHEFWQNLLDEKECLTDFTEEQLLAAGVSPKDFNHPDYVRRRGIVKNAEEFDAEFFNFTPREAELLDPQHRLFLECAWHALEDSGLDPYHTDKRVAVFGGTGSPYHLMEAMDNESVLKYANGTSIITSNDKDYVTTRVSYKLNLNGPSFNIQSACSTSMVGVVLGIDSLLNFQSDVVLAGGATVEIPATQGYMYQQGSLEAPDGKCRTFDKDAKGTVFSRGCGVVALKRLEDALEDGDHIYAVILGGAINNDGNRKAGYTAPSIQGQVEVITEAIELAGINPRSINMVEAHGTATLVGDPIEVSSLSEAFQQYTSDKQFCAIGSVKTNIGHCDVASGVASLIKTCMSLKYGTIPASLNYNESNPSIHFEESPFYVNTKTAPWKDSQEPRRALVNSFGVGGTNACVILEEPPKQAIPNAQHAYDTLFISAHNKLSVEEYAKAISLQIEENPHVNLNVLAHTSRVARSPMKYRAAIAFKDREDLLNKLQSTAAIKQNTLEDKSFVMMFPGQGNQFVNMGRELYENNASFKESIDYCSKLLQPTLGLDLREVLYPAVGGEAEASEKMAQTYITQPAIFVVSYAMAQTLGQYGVYPDALIGHSVGEYVAAAVSGIMSLEDALTAVAIRGKLVYELPQGSMLAVLKSEEEMLKILPESLDIAVMNSPELVVVSGETKDIEDFAELLNAQNVFNKLLPTSHAFHSRMMKPCLEPYRTFFNGVKLNAPSIPVISTVTGKLMTDEQAQDHEYWVQHVIDPVRFGAAATEMLLRDSVFFLECGPGQSLESAVKRQLDNAHHHSVCSTLSDGADAVITMDSALGKLWGEDVPVVFENRYPVVGFPKIEMPLLPFNRKPYTIDFSASKKKSTKVENVKKENIEDWYYTPSWKKTSAVQFLELNRQQNDPETVWLVFEAGEFSKSITRSLEGKGSRVYGISQGNEYGQGDHQFTLRTDSKEDFEKMFQELRLEDTPVNIIYTWSFSDQIEENEITYRDAPELTQKNFFTLLHLEQALIDARCTKDIRIVTLVNDAYDVIGSGRVRPEKALAVGPMRVLFKEQMGMTTLLVNIDTSSLPKLSSFLTEAVILETSSETDETIISYTGKTRWTEIFEKIHIEHEALPTSISDNGVYLITGGAGGIGRLLSILISEKVKNATFIWTGRSPLPERSEWDRIKSDLKTSSSLKERLEAIEEIEKNGSKVAFYSVEVTDFEGMSAMVAQVENEIGTINGVVHSAGVAGGGVVATQNRPNIEMVLNPKVHGTLILKEIFAKKPLDFFTLYSSITAILGEAGRVDYISGNAFMDACANAEGYIHPSAVVNSINWGQWGLIGMAADWLVETAKRKSGQDNTPISHVVENEELKLVEVRNSPEEQVIQLHIDPAKHWIINEHLVTSIPTMVGTSYIDCLMRWKKQKGLEGRVQILDSTFRSPLMLMKNMPRELYLFIQPQATGEYRFSFQSASANDAAWEARDWKEHFDGSLRLHQVSPQEKVNLEAIRANLPNKDNNQHFLVSRDANNKAILNFSNRWNCLSEVQYDETNWFSELHLPKEFHADFDSFEYHPSMVDVATSTQFSRLKNLNATFLPLGYKEINIFAPIESKCYCHTQISESEQDEKNIAFNYRIYNASGELLVEILDYVFVRIDISNQSDKKEEKELSFRPEANEDDILPNEGKRVLEVLMGQPELSQVIVYTLDLPIDFSDSKITYLRNKISKKKQSLEVAADIDDRPDLDTPYEAPENEIEKGIAAIWTVILGIHKIGLHDTFNSLGGNSLLSIQVVSGMNDEFNVVIETDEFVNNPTVAQLAELVLEKILSDHDLEDLELLLTEEG